jgi:hypothetical protein
MYSTGGSFRLVVFDKTYANAFLSVLFFAALPFIFQQAQSGRR